MSLNPRTHAVIAPFRLPFLSRDEAGQGLSAALGEIQRTLAELVELTPQAADSPPNNPRVGMQRYALPPWDPLVTGLPAWVYYDGAAWVAL